MPPFYSIAIFSTFTMRTRSALKAAPVVVLLHAVECLALCREGEGIEVAEDGILAPVPKGDHIAFGIGATL